MENVIVVCREPLYAEACQRRVPSRGRLASVDLHLPRGRSGTRIACGSVRGAPIPLNSGPNGCMCSSYIVPVGLQAARPAASTIATRCLLHLQKSLPCRRMTFSGHLGKISSRLLQSASGPVGNCLKLLLFACSSCAQARGDTE